MKHPIRLKFILISTLLILTLVGCNLPTRSAVTIAITSPENGQAIVLGQEARIVSWRPPPGGFRLWNCISAACY